MCSHFFATTDQKADVRKLIRETVAFLLVLTLRNGLIAAGEIFLLIRLLAIVLRDVVGTERVLTLFEPLHMSADIGQFLEGPLHALSWLTITTTSFVCLCLQTTVLWQTRRKIFQLCTRLRLLLFVCLLLAGILSASTLSIITEKANDTVKQFERGVWFTLLFDVTAIMRLIQSIVSGQ